MQSESLRELAKALSAAQAEMPSVKFDATNPFLKNKFASLGAVIEAARPVLAKHGLSISQFPTSGNGTVGVTTTLLHVSGEWISETVHLPIEAEKGKSMAQVAGSVITYLRRYSLSAVLGMYADEDTDGGHPAPKSEKPAPEYHEQKEGTIVTPAWVMNNYQLNAKDDKGKTAEASKIINMLGLVGKPVEVAKVRIDLYKSWRKTLDPQEAAAKTIAGEVPQEVE